MTIIELYQQHGIPFATEGHHHCRNGWVQTHCPFCHEDNFKLGYNLTSGRFNCMGCGSHDTRETLARLLHTTVDRVPWVGRDKRSPPPRKTPRKRAYTPPLGPIAFPTGTGPLKPIHRQYLEERDFDPDELVRIWQIQGIGHSRTDWAWRILIPVLNAEKVVVNYQARDITDRAPNRYRSLEDELAPVPIKQTLYGIQYARADRVLIVEGPTKVWRLGKGAVCTYGTQVTAEQRTLLRRWPNRFILFDGNAPGRRAARDLAAELGADGGHVEVLRVSDLPDDPGDWRESDAGELMNLLGFNNPVGDRTHSPLD